MDDNATCHRTLAVQDCLDSESIQRLVWPARSPELNPIENVWEALGRQVAGRNYLPTNKNTLIRALTEEWDKLPQQLLDNVVQTFRKVGGSHPRTTTAGDDRYIILQAKRGRRQSASVIAQQLSTVTVRPVSRFTVARRLHKGDLLAHRPERCLPLKVDHRRHRLQWRREHKNWTTVNGVVSSLQMRVGSVPETILNAF
ncbi:transposable element Tcb2 transposase [Trichonephila clavipes]|nr:transposable element Tcb2 transposase [Trichonephila clavipes]